MLLRSFNNFFYIYLAIFFKCYNFGLLKIKYIIVSNQNIYLNSVNVYKNTSNSLMKNPGIVPNIRQYISRRLVT